MRILVVGGTGGFGSIIARHLADDGHKVCAAGRDKNRGSAFTKNNPDIGFAVHDRSRIKPDDLANFDIVVDASGPRLRPESTTSTSQMTDTSSAMSPPWISKQGKRAFVSFPAYPAFPPYQAPSRSSSLKA